LAVVLKIVQDHGGEIFVERGAEGKTVFRMVLRGRGQEAMRGTSDFSVEVSPAMPAQQHSATQNSVSHPGVYGESGFVERSGSG